MDNFSDSFLKLIGISTVIITLMAYLIPATIAFLQKLYIQILHAVSSIIIEQQSLDLERKYATKNNNVG